MQVDNALSAATSLLYPKGLDGVVVASRQRHAQTVEAAHQARDAYIKKVPRPPSSGGHCGRKLPESNQGQHTLVMNVTEAWTSHLTQDFPHLSWVAECRVITRACIDLGASSLRTRMQLLCASVQKRLLTGYLLHVIVP